MSPTSGKTAAGTRVTVTGYRFTHVKSVRFGTGYGKSIKVLSASKLQVTAPAHAAGAVNVLVITSYGTSSIHASDRYTYVSPPAVTAVSPTAGKTAGGTRVTLAGARFVRVSAVKFGTTSGTSLKVLSTSRLQVTAPAHTAGLVGIRVTTAYGISTAVTADHYTYVAPPSSVAAVAVTAQTTTSLTLQWTNPTASGFTGVVIRRAAGSTAPSSANSGTAVASTTRTITRFTSGGLTAGTTYSYAVFAHSADAYAPRATASGTTNAALSITTTSLPGGTVGLTYNAVLAPAGGTAPYSWTATGLPAGLAISSDGVISGFPTATGTGQVTAAVTDAENTTRQVTLPLAVPDALPVDCQAQTCAHLTPDGATMQVPAVDVVSVTRDPQTNGVTQVVLTGITVAQNAVLVLAPTSDIPSGLIAIAATVTNNPDGTTTIGVTPATPADAYAEGIVQALPPVATGNTATATPAKTTSVHAAEAGPSTTRAGTTSANTPAAATVSGGSLACSGGVTSGLHGLGVSHSLSSSMAAIWKHPLFGGGGVYVGTGGLSLFQVDLNGSIGINLGASISAAATCTLTLPSVHVAVPAGALGAVFMDITPTLTLKVGGKVDIQTSLTLNCGVEYRWNNGVSYPNEYCKPHWDPLQLSADAGVDVTATASLETKITLDEIVGVTGTLSATLHAGYHPTQHPVAEIDASADFELTACLACIWSGSPATVQVAHGQLFHKTLATYDTPPSTTPPVITTTTLPNGIAGQAYSAQLTTADHRLGTWAITSGGLPPGLSLRGYTISGVPTSAGTSSFTTTFTDATGSSAAVTPSIVVGPASPPPPNTTGAISGTVRSGSSGRPLGNVEVVIVDSDGHHPYEPGYTDTLGNYILLDVPTGSYRVCFKDAKSDGETSITGGSSSTGYASQCYRDAPWRNRYWSIPADAATVSISAGQTTTGINAALRDGGEVAGRVTAASDGAPLGNVWVQVFDAQNPLPVTAITDAAGRYTIKNLQPDTYAICFDAGEGINDGSGSHRTFSDQCYKGVAWDGSYLGDYPMSVATPLTVTTNTIAPANAELVVAG